MSLPGNAPAIVAVSTFCGLQSLDPIVVARAQAHAVLALAEEQRTANLLALLVAAHPASDVPVVADPAARDALVDLIESRLYPEEPTS